MACFVTGSHEGDLRLSLEEARNKAQEATALLCQACEDMERQGISMPAAVGGVVAAPPGAGRAAAGT